MRPAVLFMVAVPIWHDAVSCSEARQPGLAFRLPSMPGASEVTTVPGRVAAREVQRGGHGRQATRLGARSG